VLYVHGIDNTLKDNAILVYASVTYFTKVFGVIVYEKSVTKVSVQLLMQNVYTPRGLDESFAFTVKHEGYEAVDIVVR